MKVGIVGASGYSGEELVGLLLRHPHVEIGFVTSRQYAGQSLASVFPRFAVYPGAEKIRFSEPDPVKMAEEAEIALLALPHGVASEYALPLLAKGMRVIDLSADFRLDDPAVYKEFYVPIIRRPNAEGGRLWITEGVRSRSRGHVWCEPGCYPTSVVDSLSPSHSC